MHSIILAHEVDFAGWREAARRLALDGAPPEQAHFSVGEPDDLFAAGRAGAGGPAGGRQLQRVAGAGRAGADRDPGARAGAVRPALRAGLAGAPGRAAHHRAGHRSRRCSAPSAWPSRCGATPTRCGPSCASGRCARRTAPATSPGSNRITTSSRPTRTSSSAASRPWCSRSSPPTAACTGPVPSCGSRPAPIPRRCRTTTRWSATGAPTSPPSSTPPASRSPP